MITHLLWNLHISCLFLSCLQSTGLSHVCYTRPACGGEPLKAAVDGSECCSRGGVSFLTSGKCYSLKCSDFLADCVSRSFPGRQEFHCRFSRRPVLAECSFDGGNPVDCFFPVAVSGARFGTELHTLVVTVVDDSGEYLDLVFPFRLQQLPPPQQISSNHSLFSNESDRDGDRVFDESDNCPDNPNRAQKDTDLDAIGDVCDNCPYDFNPEQTNNDGDALGDKCDTDDDNDKIGDSEDNCPLVYNQHQDDADSDGVGDVCDNCVYTTNSDQADSDGDGAGRACDADDNDRSVVAVLGLKSVFGSVSEGIDKAMVCLTVESPLIDCPINLPFNVYFSTTDKSAVSVEDYGSIQETKEFPLCMPFVCVDIPIHDNGILEQNEVFVVSVGLDRRALVNNITLNQTYLEVVIRDNDETEVYVGMEKSVYLVSESSSEVQLCAVLNATSTLCAVGFPFEISLSLNRKDIGNSVANASLTLLFNPCEWRACSHVFLRDDGIAEDVESFSIVLEGTPGLDERIKLDPFISELVVFDDDDMIVGFGGTEYSVAGDDDSVSVCVMVTNPPFGGALRPFTIAIHPVEETHSRCSMGYPSELKFAAGQSRLCWDHELTRTEDCTQLQVEFSLALVSSTRIQIDPDHSAAKITSRGLEPHVKVGFVHKSYTISEAKYSVNVCVNATSQGMDTDFAINIITESPSGLLFHQSSDSLHFSLSSTDRSEIKCYNISADYEVENICESFTNCTAIKILSKIANSKVDKTVEFVTGRSTAQVFVEVPKKCNCSIAMAIGTTRNGVLITVVLPSVLVLLFAIFAVLLIVIVCLYCCWSRNKKSRGYVAINRKNSSIKFISVEKTKRSVLSGQLRRQHSNRLFSRNQLEISSTIDPGEAALVYKAYLTTTTKGKELVAVKSGKALFSRQDQKQMSKELSTMLSFEHANVMSLVGICIEGELPLLIMPFMTNGSVLEFVIHNREELLCRTASIHSQVIKVRGKLLDICHQISSGMEYLTAHKFVHRNLAARNCMIDSYGVIKVGDFFMRAAGGVHDTGRSPVSVTVSEEKVPIKWMAPESIEDDVYTEATDVWSFGVTVWEIFTCGRTPYSGVPVMSLLKTLQRGQSLARPDNEACSDAIYEMMMQCLCLEPGQRPQFNTLVGRLSGMRESSEYPELSDFLCWKQDSSQHAFTVTFTPTL